MSVFEDYAPWYDLLNAGKPYADEAAFVDRRLRDFGAGRGRLLEQGSGTGATPFIWPVWAGLWLGWI